MSRKNKGYITFSWMESRARAARVAWVDRWDKLIERGETHKLGPKGKKYLDVIAKREYQYEGGAEYEDRGSEWEWDY